jgi:hypothetical protein
MKRTVIVEFGRFAVFYEGIDTLSRRRLDRIVSMLVEERRRREHASLVFSQRHTADRGDYTGGGSGDSSAGAVGVHTDVPGTSGFTRLVFTFDHGTVRCDGLRNLSENELDTALLLLVRKLKQRTGMKVSERIHAAAAYSA